MGNQLLYPTRLVCAERVSGAPLTPTLIDTLWWLQHAAESACRIPQPRLPVMQDNPDRDPTFRSPAVTVSVLTRAQL